MFFEINQTQKKTFKTNQSSSKKYQVNQPSMESNVTSMFFQPSHEVSLKNGRQRQKRHRFFVAKWLAAHWAIWCFFDVFLFLCRFLSLIHSGILFAVLKGTFRHWIIFWFKIIKHLGMERKAWVHVFLSSLRLEHEFDLGKAPFEHWYSAVLSCCITSNRYDVCLPEMFTLTHPKVQQ